jgi:hypothetical protein
MPDLRGDRPRTSCAALSTCSTGRLPPSIAKKTLLVAVDFERATGRIKLLPRVRRNADTLGVRRIAR